MHWLQVCSQQKNLKYSGLLTKFSRRSHLSVDHFIYYSKQWYLQRPPLHDCISCVFHFFINCGHFAQTKRFRWELIIVPAFCSHCLSFDWHYLLRQIKRDWKRAWWHHIFVPVCLNKVCFATRSCLVWPLLISLQPSPERVTTCFPFHPRPRYPPPIYISLICHSHHVNENLYIQFSLTSGRAFYYKNGHYTAHKAVVRSVSSY